jgi:hypothetical protein
MTMETQDETELGMLIDRFFLAVSFQDGDEPRYAGIHDLFIEAGLLIKNTSEIPEISTVEQFIEPRQKLVDSGELTYFQETELSATTESFGNVAQRRSEYDKRGVSGGAAFEGRGVIMTQFVRTPAGWRISSMAWDDERPGLTIPDR